MVCYGIFCSGQLPYRKITNKSIVIFPFTALEIVLLLLNNYFLARSKNLRWVYNVFPFEQESFQVHIAQRVPNAIGICSFFQKRPPGFGNRNLSKYTSHSEFLTPLEFVLFFKNVRHILLYMLLQQYKVRCSKTANNNSQVSRV